MKTFLDEVRATPGGEHILACIQCGTCTGSCPMAARMEHAPRQTIAMVRAGLRDEVLASNSMWFCLSCYTCTVRCPRGVQPTELAHALESLATQHGYRVEKTLTPRLYRSFVDSIEANGRVHELGMMVRYYMGAGPLSAIRLWKVGLQLFLHRRLPVRPTRIKGRDDLARILRKYREVRSHG
jgi:heterodisulfide reductase subunit C